MRAAMVPDANADAYQSAYIKSEAFARAAHHASETVRAAADASFRTAVKPFLQAAERAREAENNKRSPWRGYVR
jgi:hypothetical protein